MMPDRCRWLDCDPTNPYGTHNGYEISVAFGRIGPTGWSSGLIGNFTQFQDHGSVFSRIAETHVSRVAWMELTVWSHLA